MCIRDRPTRGSILIDGMPTAGKKTYQVNRMGVARTFQNIRLFKEMCIRDSPDRCHDEGDPGCQRLPPRCSG